MTRPLTKKERLVLYFVNQDFTNPQIAEMLVLAKNTVKVHKTGIYKKLGLIGLGKVLAQAELKLFCKANPDLFDDLFQDADNQG